MSMMSCWKWQYHPKSWPNQLRGSQSTLLQNHVRSNVAHETTQATRNSRRSIHKIEPKWLRPHAICPSPFVSPFLSLGHQQLVRQRCKGSFASLLNSSMAPRCSSISSEIDSVVCILRSLTTKCCRMSPEIDRLDMYQTFRDTTFLLSRPVMELQLLLVLQEAPCRQAPSLLLLFFAKYLPKHFMERHPLNDSATTLVIGYHSKTVDVSAIVASVDCVLHAAYHPRTRQSSCRPRSQRIALALSLVTDTQSSSLEWDRVQAY